MLPGHYATALIAKQQEPRGHILFFLVASQLADLLWLGFHYLGLERTQPENLGLASLDNLVVHMTYSHDLLPTLGWVGLVILVGRVLFGHWRPGLIGGLLVAIHAVTDYMGGYPHNLFGPDSPKVGTGMYHVSPYLAVTLEALFIVVVMAWVFARDSRRGVRRSRATLTTWAVVFGGGLAFMYLIADLSLAELTGLEPPGWMAKATIPVLAAMYLLQTAALVWAESRPPSAAASVDAE